MGNNNSEIDKGLTNLYSLSIITASVTIFIVLLSKFFGSFFQQDARQFNT